MSWGPPDNLFRQAVGLHACRLSALWKGKPMMFIGEKRGTLRKPDQDELRCSFCNKGQNEVRKLIAGPTVCICDECVQSCVEIMEQDKEARPGSIDQGATSGQLAGDKRPQAQVCTLCGLPASLDDGLAIEARRFLCPGCVGAIESAIAERNLAE